MSEFVYAGSELHIFEHAHNWKSYFASMLAPYLRGDVLEVGAGIGANTKMLESHAERWVCLEPDSQLLQELVERLPASGRREAVAGTLSALDPARRFDAIVYIDVIEHINDDAGEMRRASSRLKEGGRLIVLAPAHQWLYTPFDKKIGHHRRYTKQSLNAITPPGVHLDSLLYIDSAGLVASMANRFLLRSEMPTSTQIQMWDRRLIPISRRLDRLLGYRLGKSVVAIWSR